MDSAANAANDGIEPRTGMRGSFVISRSSPRSRPLLGLLLKLWTSEQELRRPLRLRRLGFRRLLWLCRLGARGLLWPRFEL